MYKPMFITIAVLLGIGFGSVWAQTNPRPNADQKVFTGRVPAPAGTAVRMEVLDVANARPVVCAEGVTSSSAKDTASSSTFALVLDRSCFQPGYEDVRVCWGDNKCDFIAPLTRSEFRGGETIETGLLDPAVDVPPLPASDGPNVALPATGTGFASGRHLWLLWAGLAAIGAALLLDAARRIDRRS